MLSEFDKFCRSLMYQRNIDCFVHWGRILCFLYVSQNAVIDMFSVSSLLQLLMAFVFGLLITYLQIWILHQRGTFMSSACKMFGIREILHEVNVWPGLHANCTNASVEGHLSEWVSPLKQRKWFMTHGPHKRVWMKDESPEHLHERRFTSGGRCQCKTKATSSSTWLKLRSMKSNNIRWLLVPFGDPVQFSWYEEHHFNWQLYNSFFQWIG